jgi:cardiolipin synthase C
VTVNAQTNSLYSTDGTPSAAAFSLRVPILTAQGANVWIYNGASPHQAPRADTNEKAVRWGVHSKRAVIDEKTILIGTFNVDPRSRNLNSEMAVICRNNPELAQATLADMKSRRAHSRKLSKLGQPEDGQSLLRNASLSQKMQFFLLLPVANALDFLL